MLASLAAVTKYHRLGDLNNKDVLLTVLNAGKLRSRCPDSGLGEAFLPGLQTSAFSLCPHVAERETRSLRVSSSSYKGTNLIMGLLVDVLI